MTIEIIFISPTTNTYILFHFGNGILEFEIELFLVDIGKDVLGAVIPLLEQPVGLVVELDRWFDANGEATLAEGIADDDNIGDGDLAWRDDVGMEDFFTEIELFKVDSRFEVATNCAVDILSP